MDSIKETKRKMLLRAIGWFMALPVAYLYWSLMILDTIEGKEYLFYTGFSVLFIIWSEVILRGYKKRSDKRAYFWYGVLLLLGLTASIAPIMEYSVLAIHVCAVYAVLIANSNLYEGKTGSLIGYDLINGFIFKSLPNIGKVFTDPVSINRIRKQINAEQKGESIEESSESKDYSGVAYSIGIVVGILILFSIAVSLLSKINAEFAQVIDSIEHLIDFNISISEFVFRVLLAIPVCLLLYGAVVACSSSDGKAEHAKGIKVRNSQIKLQKVSNRLISVMLVAFVAIYLLFFVLEAKYIFSGLLGILPSGFIVSQYARQGFFELVGVMVINLIIFLMVNSFCSRSDKGQKLSKILLICIMSFSVVFAIVSISKLIMYYSSFGYTPKRVLAMWGAIVLAVGAALVIAYIVKKKDYARSFIIFTVISYIVLCIVAGGLNANAPKYGRVDEDTIKLSVNNYSDEDIYSINVVLHNCYYYSGERDLDLGTISNADGSPLMTANGGSFDLYITRDMFTDGNYDFNDYTISIQVEEYGEYRQYSTRLSPNFDLEHISYLTIDSINSITDIEYSSFK